MGREVRRVPADWVHPRCEDGHFIPMDERFTMPPEDIAEGLAGGWLTNDPPYYGCEVMPQWADAERTHWQMYEDTTEGTPISPVMETPEALATWLVENKASRFGDMTADYDEWMRVINGGFGGMIIIPGGVTFPEKAVRDE